MAQKRKSHPEHDLVAPETTKSRMKKTSSQAGEESGNHVDKVDWNPKLLLHSQDAKYHHSYFPLSNQSVATPQVNAAASSVETSKLHERFPTGSVGNTHVQNDRHENDGASTMRPKVNVSVSSALKNAPSSSLKDEPFSSFKEPSTRSLDKSSICKGRETLEILENFEKYCTGYLERPSASSINAISLSPCLSTLSRSHQESSSTPRERSRSSSTMTSSNAESPSVNKQ